MPANGNIAPAGTVAIFFTNVALVNFFNTPAHDFPIERDGMHNTALINTDVFDPLEPAVWTAKFFFLHPFLATPDKSLPIFAKGKEVVKA